MNKQHNNPPDPIDEAIAPFGDEIAEAENWLDGEAIENETQMKAVDELTKAVKAAKKAVVSAEESEAKPIYDQWKAAKDRYKPTIDDLTTMIKGLVDASAAFKKKLADEKAEAERLAAQKAYAARKEAEEASRKAIESDIQAQRDVAARILAAAEAEAASRQAKREKVKGLRTVWKYEITDHRKLLHWIAANDREAVTAFIEDYARRNHKTIEAEGLRAWQEKEAF